MGESPADDVDALLDSLDDAHQAYETARERVADHGADTLKQLAEAHETLQELFGRYEERATGDGDFGVFIQFQEEMARFAAGLPEELPHRDRFERVDELMQQRRLTERDFETAREAITPVEDDIALLDERDSARERYREVRQRAERRLAELDERIADLERLQRLGEADLDAPVEDLREPVTGYNDAVADAFEAFKREESARTVVSFLDRTRAFPLVPFESPPDRLRAYVADHEAGTEPIPQLLEYADYSRSKLAHYVDDPTDLKGAVATNQTYLRRLDAEPLRVAWPPRPAAELRWRLRELVQVTGRFAPEEVVARLRDLRAWTDRSEYERLRESAVAREQLSETQRERVASGAVDEELAATREARDRLDARLAALPDP